ncbi:hypothetical protein ZPR_0370 [Zunongwangia profunda SM-A87]|uniref:Uncharacterized protein n=1 Tax=Zunongwangia profunda (strain DSM 18752 / CCTCC AB 206139 / SM-A87) TaxID=655815 RepID=D5BDY8_ZUNPS|nr:hypothetical protein ZPR_0370 [Zunongwangia profunda SM-A87]
MLRKLILILVNNTRQKASTLQQFITIYSSSVKF